MANPDALAIRSSLASTAKFNPKTVTKRKPLGNLPPGVGVGKINFHGRARWRVRLGKRFTGGKVETRSFEELSGARDFIFGGKEEDSKTAMLEVIEEGIVNLKARHGEGAFALTQAQRAEAENAFRRLPPGTSLTLVVDDWLKRRDPAGGIKTTEEAGKEFLTSRRNMGVRDRTFTMYESHLRIINEEFGDLPIADLERSHIEDWLAESEWSPRTKKNYLVTLTTLLNFSQDRQYCPGNPAARIERPLLDDSAPGILTVKQAENLLRTALLGIPEEKGVRNAFVARPQMVAGIAIGLFGGLRRSEICRLNWSEVDLEGRLIEVKASKAKTRQRRLVTISENLANWLKPFVQDSGPVAASTNEDVFGEHLREIAAAAGITIMQDGRVVPGPYTQESRQTWLRKLLEAETWIRKNGPEDVRMMELITVEELQEIRKIWVIDKHEIEDSLPQIYRSVTGRATAWNPFRVPPTSMPTTVEIGIVSSIIAGPSGTD